MNAGQYKELPEREGRDLYLRIGTHRDGHRGAELFSDPAADAGGPVEWLTDCADAARAAADVGAADQGSLCCAIAAERIERSDARADRVHIPRGFVPWPSVRVSRPGETVAAACVWATNEQVAVAAAAEQARAGVWKSQYEASPPHPAC